MARKSDHNSPKSDLQTITREYLKQNIHCELKNCSQGLSACEQSHMLPGAALLAKTQEESSADFYDEDLDRNYAATSQYAASLHGSHILAVAVLALLFTLMVMLIVSKLIS